MRTHAAAYILVTAHRRRHLLYKRFVGDAQKLASKTRRAERERQTGANGTLVQDPKTGEYRVKREEEQ